MFTGKEPHYFKGFPGFGFGFGFAFAIAIAIEFP
jgi:hypothetical protein